MRRLGSFTSWRHFGNPGRCPKTNRPEVFPNCTSMIASKNLSRDRRIPSIPSNGIPTNYVYYQLLAERLSDLQGFDRLIEDDLQYARELLDKQRSAAGNASADWYVNLLSEIINRIPDENKPKEEVVQLINHEFSVFFEQVLSNKNGAGAVFRSQAIERLIQTVGITIAQYPPSDGKIVCLGQIHLAQSRWW